jgi:pyridoxal 5'-phosphate synthase glutaminase subunit Pdx2
VSLLVGVLALQGDVREHLAMLAECGVAAGRCAGPPSCDDVDAIVIPGGESTTMSKLAVEFGLLEPLQKRLADGLPAYGSCAGMIMLASEVLDGRPDQQCLGALDITVRRNAFGRQVDSFEADVEIEGAGGVPRGVHPRALGGAGGRRRRSSRPLGHAVGSWRYASGTSSRPPSTPSSPEIFACTGSSWTWREGQVDGGVMSGHSKWATTKHKKAVVDAKRGKLFARLIKNIEVAARTGGGDPAGNPTLYDAIQKARKSSVPIDNIDTAVKRGSGAEAGGADWQTIMYEGYGPERRRLLIECLTDNRNRAATEVRTGPHPQRRHPGRRGQRVVHVHAQGRRDRAQGRPAEDDVLLAVLDAGAEEVNDLGEAFEVVSEPTDLVAVRTALQDAASSTSRPSRRSCRASRCRSTRRAPRRCSS